MKRIVIHWTAGTYQPNNVDFEHYHYLINSDGLIVKGKYKPEDNLNCNDGVYAQHTGGGNTGSIGVAMCGMLNFVSNKPESTKYPLTRVQCEACWSLVAKLCKEYNIPITPSTVLTHYEFGQRNPKTSSYGKIDISYLHYEPALGPAEVGNYIRNKVRWYFQKLK